MDLGIPTLEMKSIICLSQSPEIPDSSFADWPWATQRSRVARRSSTVTGMRPTRRGWNLELRGPDPSRGLLFESEFPRDQEEAPELLDPGF